MTYLFIQYPSCSTCRKARKWLEDNQISYESRHIAEQNPTAKELKEWIAQSGLPVKRFFNTSGTRYKEMGLKEKLPAMTEDEMIALLATDGMLVKRPLVIGEGIVLVGFQEAQWEKLRS